MAAGTADSGPPDADGIVWSGVVDERVGFRSGYGAHATILRPGGAAGILSKFGDCSTFSGRCFNSVIVKARGGARGTNFRVALTHTVRYNGVPAGAFPRGAEFGSPYLSLSLGGIVGSLRGPFGTSRRNTLFNSTGPYFRFRFVGPSLPHPVYGWAQLAVSLPGDLGGPNVILISYAYDTTGIQIPARYRGKALDGDEGAYERSGLSALALGAAGVPSRRAAGQAEMPLSVRRLRISISEIGSPACAAHPNLWSRPFAGVNS